MSRRLTFYLCISVVLAFGIAHPAQGPSQDPAGLQLAHGPAMDPHGLQLAHGPAMDPHGLRLV